MSLGRALALNCAMKLNPEGADAGDDWRKGRAIRVLRSYKGKKHSKYAPEEGVRSVAERLCRSASWSSSALRRPQQ